MNHIITDRVRSTTGRLCFDTCLSGCLSTPRGGGYPGQVQMGGRCSPARSSWMGGTPAGGYPTSGTPLLDLAGGYPTSGKPPPHQTWPGGGTPPWVTPSPPVRPGQGGYPTSGNRWSTDTPRSVCLLRSRRRTFLLVFRGEVDVAFTDQ